MTTRLIPIVARAVPDHKRVLVALSPYISRDAALLLTPAEARRIAQRLNEAAAEAEIPPEKRSKR